MDSTEWLMPQINPNLCFNLVEAERILKARDMIHNISAPVAECVALEVFKEFQEVRK